MPHTTSAAHNISRGYNLEVHQGIPQYDDAHLAFISLVALCSEAAGILVKRVNRFTPPPTSSPQNLVRQASRQRRTQALLQEAFRCALEINCLLKQLPTNCSSAIPALDQEVVLHVVTASQSDIGYTQTLLCAWSTISLGAQPPSIMALVPTLSRYIMHQLTCSR